MNRKLFLILIFTISLISICPTTAISNDNPNNLKVTFLLDKGEISSVVISVLVNDATKPLIIPVPFHLKDAKDKLNSSLISIYNRDTYGLVLVFPKKAEKKLDIICHKDSDFNEGVRFSPNTAGKTLIVPKLDENLISKISSQLSYTNVINYDGQVYCRILDDYIADTTDNGEISHSPNDLALKLNGQNYTIKIIPPNATNTNNDLTTMLFMLLSILPTLILAVAPVAKNYGKKLAVNVCITLSFICIFAEFILVYNKSLKSLYLIFSIALLLITWLLYVFINKGQELQDKLEELRQSYKIKNLSKKYSKRILRVDVSKDLIEFNLNLATNVNVLMSNNLQTILSNLTQQEKDEIETTIKNIISTTTSDSDNIKAYKMNDNPEIYLINILPFLNLVYTFLSITGGSKTFVLLDIRNKI